MQEEPVCPVTRIGLVNIVRRLKSKSSGSLFFRPLGRIRGVIVPTRTVYDPVLIESVCDLPHSIHETQLLKDALRMREQHNTSTFRRHDCRPLFQKHKVDPSCREYVGGD